MIIIYSMCFSLLVIKNSGMGSQYPYTCLNQKIIDFLNNKKDDNSLSNPW